MDKMIANKIKDNDKDWVLKRITLMWRKLRTHSLRILYSKFHRWLFNWKKQGSQVWFEVVD